MEPSKRELAAYFAAMEEDVLLQTATRRGELSAMAQYALEAEAARRSLALPPSEELNSTLEAEPVRETWVTMERFRDLSAGIVARSALEAAEIPCFLRDENTVRMDWQISNFIGGMRLQVLQQDVAAATEVLRGLLNNALTNDADGIDEPDPDRCPRCGSSDVTRAAKRRGIALTSLIFFGFPLPRGRRTWTCGHCGAEWDDES
jgi:hypothetical protein